MTSEEFHRRERKLRRTLIVAVVMFILCGGLFIGAFIERTNTLDDNLERSRKESVARDLKICQSGNTFRSEDLATWNFIIKKFPTSSDPAARKRNEEFVDYIEKKDAPKNCVKEVTGSTVTTTTIVKRSGSKP